MLRKVAEVAAKTLTPIETHSICVLLSMAFGRGTLPSRIFGRHVNAIRVGIGLPRITDAAAGNPTVKEKMLILRSAVEKLGDEAQAILIQVLLLSPMYASTQQSEPDQVGNKTLGESQWEGSITRFARRLRKFKSEGTMHTRILSERQKYRVLPTLLEVEELHLAQCDCPDECEMLRRLREDIAELRAMLSKPPPKQCREQRSTYLLSRGSR